MVKTDFSTHLASTARRHVSGSAAIVVVMVMSSVEHNPRCAVVSMPMMPADINSDAADCDIGAFRDDHRSVTDSQRTGKKRAKPSSGYSLCWGRSTSRYLIR